MQTPTFYQSYVENQRRYGDNRGVLSRPHLPPRRYRRLPCESVFWNPYKTAWTSLRISPAVFPILSDDL